MYPACATATSHGRLALGALCATGQRKHGEQPATRHRLYKSSTQVIQIYFYTYTHDNFITIISISDVRFYIIETFVTIIECSIIGIK